MGLMQFNTFSVKPTIVLAGDKTPVMTDVNTEDDENIKPTGDLADLTASVRDDMPTDEDFSGGPPANESYTGKGKDVGKGESGSSGPPVRRNKKKTWEDSDHL